MWYHVRMGKGSYAGSAMSIYGSSAKAAERKARERRSYPPVKGPMKITYADGTVRLRSNPTHGEVQRTIAKGIRRQKERSLGR